MRFFLILWAAVELLQIAVLALLVVGYRNLQRKLEEERRFASGPPRSVTDE